MVKFTINSIRSHSNIDISKMETSHNSQIFTTIKSSFIKILEDTSVDVDSRLLTIIKLFKIG